MSNDLEQFSEEVLKFMVESDHAQTGDVAALARIALAAKQAKPDYYIVRLELNDGWGVEAELNAYESQLEASKCKDDHGGVIIPCYTTPQPAHTEQSEMLNKAHSLSKSIGELRKKIDSSGGYDFEAQRSEQMNSPVIPDGWKLVPVDPTEAMLDEFDSIIDFGADDSVDAWRRLIAAAPKAESE